MFLYIHLDFFAIGTKTIDTVRKLPLFVTVLGSGSAATANVYEVSEQGADICFTQAGFPLNVGGHLVELSTNSITDGASI